MTSTALLAPNNPAEKGKSAGSCDDRRSRWQVEWDRECEADERREQRRNDRDDEDTAHAPRDQHARDCREHEVVEHEHHAGELHCECDDETKREVEKEIPEADVVALGSCSLAVERDKQELFVEHQ